MEIDGYDLVRYDRNRDDGGVAILSRNSGVVYKIRKDLMPSELEIIAVEIKIPKAKTFIFITWYRSQELEG